MKLISKAWINLNRPTTLVRLALLGIVGAFVGLFLGALEAKALWSKVTFSSAVVVAFCVLFLWLAEFGKEDKKP